MVCACALSRRLGVGVACALRPLFSDACFGYEPMTDVTPENPNDYWYSPRCLSDGQVLASASDGGFYGFGGTIEFSMSPNMGTTPNSVGNSVTLLPLMSSPKQPDPS
jgi:hypothetical protein